MTQKRSIRDRPDVLIGGQLHPSSADRYLAGQTIAVGKWSHTENPPMTFRPRTRRLAALAVAIVAGVYVSSAAGQWAWKEDNGVVVYSDRPPPPNVKSSAILRQPIVAPAPVAQSSTPT